MGVILGPAGACHRSRQLPLPDWSWTYSILVLQECITTTIETDTDVKTPQKAAP